MTEQNTPLPQKVDHIKLDERNIYIVGTAHVSKESVEDVRVTVDAIKPDAICIELCPARYKSMSEKDNWKNLDLFKIIKQKKALFLLIQLILSAFYRRLGNKLGVEPGAEMMEGARLALETDAELVLADRDVEVTLKRVWGYLSFWNKLKLITEGAAGLMMDEKIDEDLIENMKEQDQLENVLATFAEQFPQIKHRLIDERDIYLAQKIRSAPGQTIVAVVGAAHAPGIKKYITETIDLAPLEELPPKSILPTILKWSVPALVVGLILWGFFSDNGGTEHTGKNLAIWVLVNGILSAIGAAIAFAHPLTIITSFFAAPLTSINPTIGAGYVAGIVQTWIKKPKVADFEDLPNAIASAKGFWKNPVTRILLVVILSSLGSALGTWIALIWIASRSVA